MPKKDSRKQNRFEAVGDMVRIFQRNGQWYANYQYEGKQTRESLNTTNKKEAQRRALRLEDEVLAGLHRHAARVPTIEAVIEAYRRHLNTERRARKTLVKYEKVFARVVALATRRRARNLLDVNLPFMD